MKFEDGMVCFSGGDSFMQRGIRFFTRSKFSHSFVVVKIDGVLCALETTSTKVVCKPVDEKYSESNYIECWTMIESSDQVELFLKTMAAKYFYEGAWYAYQSYPWFIYNWFLGLFGRESKTMWRWCQAFSIFKITCTELTCKSLKNKFKPDMDENAVTPQKLRDNFLTIPNLIKKVGWIKLDKEQ
jgi:hypothetical protein